MEAGRLLVFSEAMMSVELRSLCRYCRMLTGCIGFLECGIRWCCGGKRRRRESETRHGGKAISFLDVWFTITKMSIRLFEATQLSCSRLWRESEGVGKIEDRRTWYLKEIRGQRPKFCIWIHGVREKSRSTHGKRMDNLYFRDVYLDWFQYFSSNPSTMEPSKVFTHPLMPPLSTRTFSSLRRPNLATSSI